MNTLQEQFRARRVYEITPATDGAVALRLNDRMVELGEKELASYRKVVDWLPSTAPVEDLARDVGMEPARIGRFLAALEKAGLLYRRAEVPKSTSGEQFHAKFNVALTSWLTEAFAHPFWERMMSGRGSARLFTGW